MDHALTGRVDSDTGFEYPGGPCSCTECLHLMARLWPYTVVDVIRTFFVISSGSKGGAGRR